MQIKLSVDAGDGPFEISTNLFTIVAWERKYKRKASDMASGIGIEDLAFLAYTASQQHGVVVPVSFDDYIKKLVSIDVVSEETVNPTHAAPTDTL
jgi:hypothetical protein